MKISQIYITDSGDEEIPAYARMAVSSVVNAIPHSDHKIYRKEELRQWIADEYGTSMLLAFDKLVPYAFKADLARYLLLYKQGGWYFDVTIRVINGVDVQDHVDMITFLDLPQYSGVSFACNNAIIFSKAKNKILESAIDLAYSNIKNSYYGPNCLYPTGPACLGRSVAKLQDNLNVLTGTLMDLTPGFADKNRGFIFNDGTLFALHKPGSRGGDMAYLGAKGTNNYGLLYEQRKIYNEAINVEDKQSNFQA